MFIVTTKIFINQVPNLTFPTRNGEFVFDFVTEFESSDSWRDFTNNAKITLPKNVYYTDHSGKRVYLGNVSTNLGGFSSNIPSFLKGDEITIISGYKYMRGGQEIEDTATFFTGFISKVSSKKPFTLECEDNMYKLKQLPAPNKLFLAKSYTLESMLRELLQGTQFTVNALTKTSIGDFRVQNETVMDVLSRLRKDYHFESYFRGNELRCGSLVYIEADAKNYNFIFQNNIISDELEYSRKDDIVLSAIAYSVNKNQVNTITKDGHPKTKMERLEVLVTYQNGTFRSEVKPAGGKADFPPNYTGERRTLYFWNVATTDQLIQLAQAELIKYYYTGFKGKFTTFGIPFVRMGDNVSLYNPVLPEQNGQYKVKSVEYKLSIGGGLRQTIELDYKIKDLGNYSVAQLNRFVNTGILS